MPVYSSAGRKKRLIEEALVEYRLTRRKLSEEHAEFFAQIEEIVQNVQRETALRKKILEAGKDNTSLQRKNMMTISRFLELRGKSETIDAGLREIIKVMKDGMH